MTSIINNITDQSQKHTLGESGELRKRKQILEIKNEVFFFNGI